MICNNFTCLSEVDLLEISGGSFLPTWVYNITSEVATAYETVIKETDKLADTAYNAGKKLGSYIRNF